MPRNPTPKRAPEGIPEPTCRLWDRVAQVFGYGDMPVICADAIAQQIDEMPDAPIGEEPISFPAEWYGVVAPPFKKFFVEATCYRYAHTSFLMGRPIYIDPGYTQRGALCFSVTPGDPHWSSIVDNYHRRNIMPSGTHWVIAMYCYMYESGTRTLSAFAGTMFAHLDRDGKMLDNTNSIKVIPSIYQYVCPIPPDETPRRISQYAYVMPAEASANFFPFMMKAISAMHKRCEAEEVDYTPQEKYRAERHDKIVLHKHYVLKVKPTPTRKVSDFIKIGSPDRTSTRKHTVRGHFRYYWPSAPLFGRITGAVWVPTHQRGNDQYGDIGKDYEVQP